MGYEFAGDGNKMSGLTVSRTLWKIILLNGQLFGINCWSECRSELVNQSSKLSWKDWERARKS